MPTARCAPGSPAGCTDATAGDPNAVAQGSQARYIPPVHGDFRLTPRLTVTDRAVANNVVRANTNKAQVEHNAR
jgi:hypothetical protein